MSKIERAWINDMLQIGCICCRLFLNVFSPAECHHLLSGGRRRGHLFTIPLCPTHHRSGRNDEEVVSRDQNQRRFEKRYGSEESLLARTRELVQRNATIGQPSSTR
jgi:hypothetical protein